MDISASSNNDKQMELNSTQKKSQETKQIPPLTDPMSDTIYSIK